MMTSQILKFVDFTKTPKSRYLENKTFFLQIKKIINQTSQTTLRQKYYCSGSKLFLRSITNTEAYILNVTTDFNPSNEETVIKLTPLENSLREKFSKVNELDDQNSKLPKLE